MCSCHQRPESGIKSSQSLPSYPKRVAEFFPLRNSQWVRPEPLSTTSTLLRESGWSPHGSWAKQANRCISLLCFLWWNIHLQQPCVAYHFTPFRSLLKCHFFYIDFSAILSKIAGSGLCRKKMSKTGCWDKDFLSRWGATGWKVRWYLSWEQTDKEELALWRYFIDTVRTKDRLQNRPLP